MATPTASREQQAAQTGLSVLMLRELAGTWRLLNPARLAGTMPQWIAAVNDVIDRYGQAAGAMALDYYDAERAAAGVSGRSPTTLLREPDPDQIENSLRWATKNLWDQELLDNAVALERELEEIAHEEEAAIADLADLDEDDLAEIGEDHLDEEIADPEPQPAADDPAGQARASRTKVDGIASRLVGDVGRGAIVDAVAEDRAAVAVARRAAPDACAFCRVMAIRGAVYKNEQTAGRAANSEFAGAGEFKYHNHCRCWATPLFEGEEWQPQPQIELWEQQYQQARAMPGDTISNFYRLLRVS
ncbi:hypothetical protein BJF79_03680 [Actinomadura sp. CNU-125]|uniref:VG15 protein n=1 Tax=Actinomadura sp. CNU-125 TaxID=1904961 RepID=UPI0009633315|nr:hypothetical protein [Actinomadura sp. CNU-125]OLT13011.1 hypothetical protein BJF79_03680 [Actinomadura sp. CNU-125]